MDAKKHYEIRVDATVPCQLTYRVYADDPQEALRMIEKQPPSGFHPYMNRRRPKEAKVYRAGTLQLEATKRFHG